MVEKYRFHEKIIHIHGGNDVALTIEKNQVIIKSHDLASQFLLKFGEIFSKLCVSSKHFNLIELADIYQKLNDHCSKSLNSLEFDGLSINPFTTWSHTFEGITSLAIENLANVALDMTKPHEIFPNLQNLQISIDSIANLPFFTENFMNLQHLYLKSVENSEENSHLLQFLEGNGHLISIELEIIVNFDLLRGINEKLPHLKRLKLHSPSKDFFSPRNCDERIIFMNVQDFSVSINLAEHSKAECIPLAFGKLQKMQLLATSLTRPWVEFLKRHTLLQHISMPWIEPTYDDLHTIIDNNLVGINEIGVQWTPTYRGEDVTNGIVQIMHETNSLRKVTIWMNSSRDFSSDFLALVAPNWTTIDRNAVGMRRFVSYFRLNT